MQGVNATAFANGKNLSKRKNDCIFKNKGGDKIKIWKD